MDFNPIIKIDSQPAGIYRNAPTVHVVRADKSTVESGFIVGKPGNGDRFASLDALKEIYREGVDYTILANDRKSWATIVSPHGGYIESGTTEIGGAIAGGDYNFFAFNALKQENVRDLHVTSENFRDPKLSDLLSQSSVALSIHGRADRGDGETVWIGGLNLDLKAMVGEHLKAEGFQIELHPEALKGTSPQNFVNCVERKGVQLELPATLRQRLVPQPGATSDEASRFVEAIRKALGQYKNSI